MSPIKARVRDHLAADVALAMARAWEAAAVYGLDHPSTIERARAAELTRPGGRVVLEVTAEGLTVGAGLLEPRAQYAGLAGALRQAGASALEVRAPVEATHLALLHAAIGRAMRDEDSAGLAELERATGGSLRARLPDAGRLRLRAGGRASGRARLSGRALEGARREQSSALDLLARLAETHGEGSADDGDTPMDLGSIRAVLSAVPAEDRREVVSLLGSGELIGYRRAVEILDHVPLGQFADAMAVLTRPDAHASQTSLMLLKRLSHLAMGREVDLDRLASIAETWSADEGEGAEVARSTASLLRRASTSEFRSAEYTSLLRSLCEGTPPDGRGPMATVLEDEVESISHRAATIALDALEVDNGGTADRCALLRLLEARVPALASLGEVALVSRALTVSSTIAARSQEKAERDAARAVLDASLTGEWLARALGSSASGGTIRGVLRAIAASDPEGAASMYVAAAAHSGRGARMDSLLNCLDVVGAERVAGALEARIAGDPGLAPDLTQLIARVCPERALDLLRPSLVDGDAGRRRRAFAALADLGREWPGDLRVRGVMDSDERVRLMTIDELDSRGDGAGLLVDRFAGVLGECPLGSDEELRLAEALLRDGRAETSRRLARRAVWSAWTGGSAAGRRRVASVLARRRDAWSRGGRALAGLSPLSWSRGGRRAA